jgi:hypothetical protein
MPLLSKIEPKDISARNSHARVGAQSVMYCIGAVLGITRALLLGFDAANAKGHILRFPQISEAAIHKSGIGSAMADGAAWAAHGLAALRFLTRAPIAND